MSRGVWCWWVGRTEDVMHSGEEGGLGKVGYSVERG